MEWSNIPFDIMIEILSYCVETDPQYYKTFWPPPYLERQRPMPEIEFFQPTKNLRKRISERMAKVFIRIFEKKRLGNSRFHTEPVRTLDQVFQHFKIDFPLQLDPVLAKELTHAKKFDYRYDGRWGAVIRSPDNSRVECFNCSPFDDFFTIMISFADKYKCYCKFLSTLHFSWKIKHTLSAGKVCAPIYWFRNCDVFTGRVKYHYQWLYELRRPIDNKMFLKQSEFYKVFWSRRPVHADPLVHTMGFLKQKPIFVKKHMDWVRPSVLLEDMFEKIHM